MTRLEDVIVHCSREQEDQIKTTGKKVSKLLNALEKKDAEIVRLNEENEKKSTVLEQVRNILTPEQMAAYDALVNKAGGK